MKFAAGLILAASTVTLPPLAYTPPVNARREIAAQYLVPDFPDADLGVYGCSGPGSWFDHLLLGLSRDGGESWEGEPVLAGQVVSVTGYPGESLLARTVAVAQDGCLAASEAATFPDGGPPARPLILADCDGDVDLDGIAATIRDLNHMRNALRGPCPIGAIPPGAPPACWALDVRPEPHGDGLLGITDLSAIYNARPRWCE